MAALLRFVVVLTLIPPSFAFAELHMQWARQLPERQPAWEFTQRMPQDRAYVPAAAGDLAFVGCEHNGALLALDAATGEAAWTFYTNAPIRVAPLADEQRVYVASDDGYLYCLDHDGQLQWKFRGGPSDRWIIGHDRLISPWAASAAPLLVDGKVIYQAGHWPVDGVYLHAVNAKTGERVWTTGNLQFRPYGEIRREGDQIYVYGFHGNGIFDLGTGKLIDGKPPKPQSRPELPETPGVKGGVAVKVQAGERIIVSTRENWLHGFAPQQVEPQEYPLESAEKETSIADDALTSDILQRADVSAGYCLVVGIDDGAMLRTLLEKSVLNIVAVDGDARRVAAVRRMLDAEGRFQTRRLSIIATDPAEFTPPPYFARLVIANNVPAGENIQAAMRPFGGKLVEISDGKLAWYQRDGAPEGSDNWAQEFCDAANTLASGDKLVKAPLGLLWYGGEAADARFYFDGNVDHQSGHGLNPQPVSAHVVDGRMILQGPGRLAAVDIYTGRILWETKLPEVYTFGGGGGGLGIHSKKHPRPWEHPAALEAEVPATHRCRASGFNMASTHGYTYVAADQHILRVRQEDGKIVDRWPVPESLAQGASGDEILCWGGIRHASGVIVATLFRPKEIVDAQAGHDGNGGDWAGDRMPMKFLVGVDEETGKLLWQREADWGYINRSGVCASDEAVFAVDLITSKVHAKLKEAGRELPIAPPRVVALDLKSGRQLWQYDLDVYVQNIAYAEAKDAVLIPCRNLKEWRDGQWVDLSIDKRRGKRNKHAPGRMRLLSADEGKVLWQVEESAYHTPIIVLDDLMIDRYGNAFDLADGTPNKRVNPLTGQPQAWSFRKRGCNHLIACENLITWRCAFYDLGGGSGAMQLSGMDAGCTPTLLPACGVLNIPNFGTHHKRNRMTAVGLVHRPNNELWTKFAEKPPEQARPIVNGGFNFGALGDRIDPTRTVWLAITQRKREEVRWQPKDDVQWFETYSEDDDFAAYSGVMGAEEITVPVTFGGKPSSDQTKRPYTVELIFLEPSAAPGERVFDVLLEGETVIEKLDVAKQAGGANKPLVRKFEIEVTDALDIRFAAAQGEPVISAVRLIAGD